MKIALIAERVDPWRGGAETSTMQFVQHLLEQGIEVDLFTRSRLPDRAGLRVLTIDTHGLSRGYRTLRFIQRVDKMLSDGYYELVHAITPCLRADVYQPRGGTIPETISRNLAMRKGSTAGMVKRLGNRFNLRQRILLKHERELISRRSPPMIIALSDYVVRQLKEHYGVDSGCVRKIFNGADDLSCDPRQKARDRQAIRNLYNIGEEEVFALFVSHNFKLKGLAQWLRALSIIKKRASQAIGPQSKGPQPKGCGFVEHTRGSTRIKSVVVGKGNALPYRRLARSLGTLDLVTFAGPTRRIPAFLHAADVFVHPTFYDPCSRVVLEAMLSGVPCVTTRFNGAAEVIEDGVNGRVIDSPDDIEALAGAVEQVTAPRFRQALISSHDDLAERLSMKRHTAEVVDLYRSLTKAVPVL